MRLKFTVRHFAFVLAAVLFSAPVGWSADAIAPAGLSQLPPGTTLPVALRGTLRAGKTPVGSPVAAITIQRVPIGPGVWLRHGAQLSGTVVASSDEGGVSKLGIRFDALHYHGKTIAIGTEALAIASNMEVSQTAMPANGSSDRGNPDAASWTTTQIGGDEVYRSGWVGPVCSGTMRKVGYADFNGVYGYPVEHGSESNFMLAMGPFSTSARGLYGYDPGDRVQSKNGVVELEGPSGKVELRDGDNLLLQVVGASGASVKQASMASPSGRTEKYSFIANKTDYQCR